MASGPITSWEIDGETIETVSDFIFLGSKITVDDDCSHEIKRFLLLGRKLWPSTGMTHRDGMGREVGGGFRMGKTDIPVVDTCWCMVKPIQYC